MSALPSLIPEDYVPDLNVRLSLYRRLSDAEQAEDRVKPLAAELIDRFGPLPDEAQQLLKIVGIKANCRKACIEKIDIGPRGAVLTLRDNSFPNPVGTGRADPEEPRLLEDPAGSEDRRDGRLADGRRTG